MEAFFKFGSLVFFFFLFFLMELARLFDGKKIWQLIYFKKPVKKQPDSYIT